MFLNDFKICKLKFYFCLVKFFDFYGLYLFVNLGGLCIWYFKYCFNGKEFRVSFGVYLLVLLVEVRQQCDGICKLLVQNINLVQQCMVEKVVCFFEKCFKVVVLVWYKINKKWLVDYVVCIFVSMENYIFLVVGYLFVVKFKMQDFIVLLRVIEDKGFLEVVFCMWQ